MKKIIMLGLFLMILAGCGEAISPAPELTERAKNQPVAEPTSIVLYPHWGFPHSSGDQNEYVFGGFSDYMDPDHPQSLIVIAETEAGTASIAYPLYFSTSSTEIKLGNKTYHIVSMSPKENLIEFKS